jgi:large subunit ribosomal protein L9
MKVILLQNVDRLGKAGETVDVAAGYGRNFLIPRGYAEVLTKKGQKQIELKTRIAQKHAETEFEHAKALASKIEGQSFDVKQKAGARGKLYGAVTTIVIAEALALSAGTKIDKRNITIHEPIRMLGSYDISVKLHPDVNVDFKINVTAAEGSKIEAVQ